MFLHPLFLLGLLAVGIPIYLHLFDQRKLKVVDFPPIEFLKRVMEKRQKRSKMREIILLLLRALFLVLVTITAARYYHLNQKSGALSPGSIVKLFILDNSASMSSKKGSVSFFEVAKNRAKEKIEQMNPNDLGLVLSLIPMSQEFSVPTNDHQKLITNVDALPIMFETGNIWKRLQEVEPPLAGLKTKREVWFFSDGTDVPWRGEYSGNLPSEFHFLDVSEGKNVHNAQLIDLKLDQGFALIQANSNLNLTVFVEEQKGKTWELVDQKTIHFEKEGEEKVPISVGKGPTEKIIRVRLEGDDYPLDNIRYALLPPEQRLSTLIVNGNPRPESRDDAAYFFVTALSHKVDQTAISEAELSHLLLEPPMFVALLDVGQIEPSLSLKLQKFVSNGGVLFVGLGERSTERSSNDPLQLLLPALIRNQYTATPKEKITFSSASFFKWLTVSPKPGSEVKLSLSNGIPLLLKQQLGKGSVWLWTSSFNRNWNDWVVSSQFPAWVQELLKETLQDVSQDVPELKTEIWGGREKREPGIYVEKPHLYTEVQPSPEESRFIRFEPKELTPIEVKNNEAGKKEMSSRFALLALLFLIFESFISGRIPKWKLRKMVLFLFFILLPFSTWALQMTPDIVLTQLFLNPSKNNPCPHAYVSFLKRAPQLANLQIAIHKNETTLQDPNLFSNPFLFLCGDRSFQAPKEGDVSRLRRFLLLGGFLFIDNVSGNTVSGEFDSSVRKLLTSLFPDQPLRSLDARHVVFQSYYLLNNVPSRLADSSLYGIEIKHRTTVMYFTGDLAGTLDTEVENEFLKRVEADRFFLNVLMYSLTLDYKQDQIHMPFILERKR